jgi:hypothetical protein
MSATDEQAAEIASDDANAETLCRQTSLLMIINL